MKHQIANSSGKHRVKLINKKRKRERNREKQRESRAVNEVRENTWDQMEKGKIA